MSNYDIKVMAELIKQIRQLAETLDEKGKGNESVKRNIERMLACVYVLELNISDAKDLV